MMSNSKEINIAGRAIGLGHSPFIIAEMSGNHNQSLERALEIDEAAAKAGAHGCVMRPLIKIGDMVSEAPA